MPADPKLVESLFHAARADPSALAAADPAVRARVEQLLAAHAELGSIPGATAGYSAAPADGPAVGTVVGGRYRLLEVIGEGGMGTVYMAEQTEPVRRLVALKLVKAGMDSKAVLARFEAERQALALMDHPNIARVLDAGASDDGRPFFVMELVKGTPITAFCDERKLTTRERLELFVPVCLAIQHAHQKGVIHRDIKPSNVLVALYDDRPVPKVIDFGVAKAAGSLLTEATLHTGFGSVVGTPEYMSPEQASFNNLDVDTRSDVYALGVLLYELLTGTTPVDAARFKQAALLEVLRVVREEEPPRPSMKLSTAEARAAVAAARGTEPGRLAKLLRGELDWVVMRALEKDRDRRYDSAAGLAKDVQRHLAGEMVEARAPTLGYRLWKFARRRWRERAAVALAAAVIGPGMYLAYRTWSDSVARRDAAELHAFEMVRYGNDHRAEEALKEAEAAGVTDAQVRHLREELRQRRDRHGRPEEHLEHWLYPGAGVVSTSSGGFHLGVYVTPDPAEKVAAWYEERIGTRIALDGNFHGGGGGPDVFTATTSDSFRRVTGRAGEPVRRPVRVGIATRRSDASVLTLVINRADGEDATHIVLSFSR
ncbi:serine/threonine-protein kinase [Urbifossiella limnaea]|uniref:Serine/threonine-protein kinase Pkn1 n=1 Tax=Urbifossiella limnaea TaxID=2528023 RepID=A0A517XPG5_9BACT|nr:serine/threonine-protein kinase [Urbifossiella limnaea]QDU19397.1 Serine/threonine-protein kinase Pkn1 [Urbifossiella limnaea]